MEKAKAAVGHFLSKDGKHDTTVHETVNPAVQHEKIIPTRHEDVNTAIDREVHQDHYHTSVQPIKDREILPEEHTHNMAAVEHRNIKHGDEDHVKQKLAAEAAQFKHTKEVASTQVSQGSGNTVVGEHVHHHVHENIQPVINKETVQPTVVHNTIPIHEVHQNEAKHHNASALPAVTMEEFKRQGGHLSGREERTDAFGGEPRSVGGTLGGAGAKGTTSLTESDTNRSGNHTGSHLGTAGTTGTHTGTHTGSGITGTGHTGTHTTGTTGSGLGHTTGTTGTHTGNGLHNTTSHDSKTKPSLMDKLNPKKDADGDGKAGFMK